MYTTPALSDLDVGESDELSVTRLFDLALDLLCVAGTDGYFKRVNNAFERTLGYSKDELRAIPFVDFVHPEDVDSTLAAIAQLEHGEVVTDFENRFRTRSGEWRWLVWRSMPSDDGRYIYACARDITDEKHTLAVADERGEIMARQSKDLERVGLVHRTMTQAVADGATTIDVLRAVSDLTGKPTALFSAAFKVLHCVAPGGAASSSGDWTIESAAPRVRRSLAAVDGSRPSIVLPAMPELGINVRHLIGRVVARGEDIGYLLIAEVGTGLSSFDAQVVEHSSTVLSLELVSSRRQLDAESQAREDFLADLLQGDREPARLIRRSASYGIDLDEPHVLVRVSWDPTVAAPHHRLGPPRLPGATARRAARRPAPRHGRRPGRRRACSAACRRSPAGPRSSRCAPRSARRSTAPGLRTKSRGALVSGICAEVADYAAAHRDLRVGAGVDGERPGRTAGRAASATWECCARSCRPAQPNRPVASPTNCSRRCSSAIESGAELVVHPAHVPRRATPTTGAPRRRSACTRTPCGTG